MFLCVCLCVCMCADLLLWEFGKNITILSWKQGFKVVVIGYGPTCPRKLCGSTAINAVPPPPSYIFVKCI